MKTVIILVFLVGLSSAFFINRHGRKPSDFDKKALAQNRYAFYRNTFLRAPYRHAFIHAKGGDSSEENGDSSDEEDSSEHSKNGYQAGSTGPKAPESEGKKAAEEANSDEGEEEENENGGTSAPEVEDTTANLNETEIEEGEESNTTESHMESLPTQTSTIVVDVTDTPASTVDEVVGNEEGSNGYIASTATYETPNNGYQYENGYEHENEVYYKGRGDTYARYEDEYHYRNRVYDQYGREYEYYQ
uniref:Integrin-binding sialoprotein n=1 Tax=Leptobrachium leishanense TaxID=445787 RepID=A0A8C5MNI1_9ANUR